MPPSFEVLTTRVDAWAPLPADRAAFYDRLNFSLLVGRLAPGTHGRTGGPRLQGADAGDARGSALPGVVRADRAAPGSADGDDRRHAIVAARARRRGRADAADRRREPRHAARRQRRLARARVRRARRDRRVARRAGPAAARRRGSCSPRRRRRAGLALAVAQRCRCSSRLLPKDTPRTGDIRVDGTVTIAVLGAALLVALLFALAPSFTAGRRTFGTLLREGAATESRATRRTRGAMVAVEIALALVLTIGAGLMLRTLVQPAARRSRHRRRSHPDAAAAAHVARLQGARRHHRLLRPGARAHRRDPRRHRGRRDPAPAVQRHRAGSTRSRSKDSRSRAGEARPDRRLQDDHRRLLPRRRPAPARRTRRSRPRIARSPIRRSSSTKRSPGAISAARRPRSVGACAPAAPRGAWVPIAGVVSDVRTESLDKPSEPEFYTRRHRRATCRR